MTQPMGLPTGPAVTFLFTDIEGSTRLERAVGSAAWAGIVARHDALLRGAIETNGGAVVKTEGDAFFAAFARPVDAVRAAVDAQRALAAEPWPDDATLRVRMGLHLGEGRLRHAGPDGDHPEDYVGIDVNYTARITAAGNGGQVVVSDALAIAVRDDVAAKPALGDAELVDEGLRAVKDFDDPARLHRLVIPGAADDIRRLRTSDAPSNLPGEVTALVGREAEIELLREALGTSRIVTLTGPGGSGKTRLALGVARTTVDRFPHGSWFVDLAALREPTLLEAAIAATIGVRETTDQTVAEALGSRLRDQTALFVLDNLEQLLPDAADRVAGLVRAAPEIRILVTSRELLRISGERGFPVPPLDGSAGVALFEDRARGHRPDFLLTDEGRAAIRAICDRLGGLPLAIELAAARIRTLSPAQILERLGRSLDLAGGSRDLPERQRTLRGAITWSHDLLSDAERRLFRRLAVFAGGWTVDGAEAVTNADGDLGIDLVDGLESLADKSLVRVEPDDDGGGGGSGSDETRFGLHPLLREYAVERLEDGGELAAMQLRHADLMTVVAERLGSGILGADGEARITRLDHEEYNLRAAIDWSLANDRSDVGLRLMATTWRWFQQRGRLREGLAILAELLARPAGDVRVRIGGLAAQGGLAYWMDDLALARAAYDERLELASGTGDPVLVADAHYDRGFLSMAERDGESLRRHEQEALNLYLAADRGDDVLRARSALVLGVFLAGDDAQAIALQEENLAAYRRNASRNEIADASTLLAGILFRHGEPALAWERMIEGLRTFAASEFWSGIARDLVVAAQLQVVHGDAELGARVAGAVHELARERGLMLAPIKILHLPDPAELAVERLGQHRAEELLRAGAAVPIDEVIDEVLAAPVPTGALV